MMEISWHTIMEIEWHSIQEIRWHNMMEIRHTIEEPGKNVAAKSGLNREILAVGWHRFQTYLTYKALRKGKIVFKVNPHYSSQECAICSHTHQDNRLTQSEFCCVQCGHKANADTNAAAVLKNRLAKLILDSGTELRDGVLRLSVKDGRDRKITKSSGQKDSTTRQKRQEAQAS
jgi:putative transposase